MSTFAISFKPVHPCYTTQHTSGNSMHNIVSSKKFSPTVIAFQIVPKRVYVKCRTSQLAREFYFIKCTQKPPALILNKRSMKCVQSFKTREDLRDIVKSFNDANALHLVIVRVEMR